MYLVMFLSPLFHSSPSPLFFSYLQPIGEIWLSLECSIF